MKKFTTFKSCWESFKTDAGKDLDDADLELCRLIFYSGAHGLFHMLNGAGVAKIADLFKEVRAGVGI